MSGDEDRCMQEQEVSYCSLSAGGAAAKTHSSWRRLRLIDVVCVKNHTLSQSHNFIVRMSL